MKREASSGSVFLLARRCLTPSRSFRSPATQASLTISLSSGKYAWETNFITNRGPGQISSSEGLLKPTGITLTDSQDDRNYHCGPATDSAEKNDDFVIERHGGEERVDGDPEAHSQHISHDSDPSDDRPAAKITMSKGTCH